MSLQLYFLSIIFPTFRTIMEFVSIFFSFDSEKKCDKDKVWNLDSIFKSFSINKRTLHILVIIASIRTGFFDHFSHASSQVNVDSIFGQKRVFFLKKCSTAFKIMLA